MKIKQKELVNKSDIVKSSDLNTKFAKLGTKAEIKAERDETVKTEAFDSSYWSEIRRFESKFLPLHGAFLPNIKYFGYKIGIYINNTLKRTKKLCDQD